MNTSLMFVRVFFTLTSILFTTAYTTNLYLGGLTINNLLLGLVSGLCFAGFAVSLEMLFKRFDLRAFNIASLGILFGAVMGGILLFAFEGLLTITSVSTYPEVANFLKLGVFLISIYLGMVMTLKASEELYISIPFVRLKKTNSQKKDLLLDASILMDSRIIDLASSGLLDNHLLLPKFIIKELYEILESSDEFAKNKAKRSLDIYKKLEAIAGLDLRYTDMDFPEIKDMTTKFIRLASLTGSNILTADISRVQQSSVEGIKIININALSNALKPLTNQGEFIQIKILRFGKEAGQGIGYLDDGTMVVVNGGGEFIHETIKAQVLSVKSTSSGRIIFCNACIEEDFEEELNGEESFAGADKNFFSF